MSSLLLCLYLIGGTEPLGRFQHLTEKEGLPTNIVSGIAQDNLGYLWFGTLQGLYRYDGYDYEAFRHDPDDPRSLAGDAVWLLMTDREGLLWVGLQNGGLHCYHPETRDFTRIQHNPDDPNTLLPGVIQTMVQDRLGGYWIGTSRGLTHMKDETFRRFVHDPNNPETIGEASVRALAIDEKYLWIGLQSKGLERMDLQTGEILRFDEEQFHSSISDLHLDGYGRLWIAANGGLSRLDTQSLVFTQFPVVDEVGALQNGDLIDIHEDSRGNLWIATNGGGLFRWSEQRGLFDRFRKRADQAYSLTGDLVALLFEDRNGMLWISTRNEGLSIYNPVVEQFEIINQDLQQEGGLSGSAVRDLLRDDEGRMWIATNGGGLNRLEHDGSFRYYRQNPDDPGSLSDDRVYALAKDHDGVIWVGTSSGLERYRPATDDFRHYSADETDPDSLNHNSLRSLYVDRLNNLWVGTKDGGLNRLGPDRLTFEHFHHDPGRPDSLPHNRVYDITEDADGGIWVATLGGGIGRLDPSTGLFANDRSVPGQVGSLSTNRTFSLLIDRDNRLWVGTTDGLNLRNDDGSYTRFGARDGLPDDTVLAMAQAPDGALWMTTNRGLSRLDLDQLTFRNFSTHDGLIASSNEPGSVFVDDERLWFGTSNGALSFAPAKIQPTSPPPPVVLTQFLVANQAMRVRAKDPASPLVTAIEFSEKLKLSYKTRAFAIKFSALSYLAPEKNSFEYRLKPFDETWIKTESDYRIASYTNLDAGDYIFEVRAANREGAWREPVQLALRVPPPPWLSWWAITSYVLIVMGAAGIYVRAQKLKLKREREVSNQLRYLDKMKDEFLANTSHELRTPLNGIIGIVESLIDGVAGKLPDAAVKNLSMVLYSGIRLSNLVNDILDFSKLKKRNLELSAKSLDLRSFADVVLSLSKPLLDGKEITLYNDIPGDATPVMADENRLQQILHNLIGNAIKFTESGEVRIGAEERGDRLAVWVQDTGIGIPSEKHEAIFESFEQVSGEAERDYGGAGLGLAITRNLVELHGGVIDVASTVGEGSTFTFTLPLSDRPAEEFEQTRAQSTLGRAELTDAELVDINDPEVSQNQSFTILIVDDEPVNRQVLVNHLGMKGYRLLEAEDGVQALAKLDTDSEIDLILLDVMMPKLTGYEVCQKVREHHPVQELPIILLTAKNQVTDLVTGFAAGANDYLTKPIAKSELYARVRTHLELLDVNRNLEDKVSERTAELQRKNDEILRTQNQLVIQNKMASLVTLASGIAHEIKNPLNFINNFASVSGDYLGELRETNPQDADTFLETIEDLQQNIELIMRHGRRANDIVERMMGLVREGPNEWSTLPINAFVQEYVEIARLAFCDKHPEFEVQVDVTLDERSGRINAGGKDLSRALVHVTTNAFDAMLEQHQLDPTFHPHLKVTTDWTDESVKIVLIDNGGGVAEEHLEEIFTPFFTTKSPDAGNIGLGLSLSYDIVVTQHGGSLVVESTETGARCVIELPVNAEAPAAV